MVLTSIIVIEESARPSCPTVAGRVLRVKRDANSSLDRVSSCERLEQLTVSSISADVSLHIIT
jgi:hypothetical protein